MDFEDVFVPLHWPTNVCATGPGPLLCAPFRLSLHSPTLKPPRPFLPTRRTPRSLLHSGAFSKLHSSTGGYESGSRKSQEVHGERWTIASLHQDQVESVTFPDKTKTPCSETLTSTRVVLLVETSLVIIYSGCHGLPSRSCSTSPITLTDATYLTVLRSDWESVPRQVSPPLLC